MASLHSVVGIALLATASGCVDEGGETLVVINNSIPEAGCMVSPAGAGDPILGFGQVDAAGAIAMETFLGYVLTPTILNIADGSGDRETQRTVLTDGARVRVVPGNGPDGMPILTQAELDALGAVNTTFTTLFTVPITPGGTASAAFDVLPVQVLRAIGAKLPDPLTLAQVTVEVEVFGETLSGTNVESDAFRYPITICNGCQRRNLGSCVGLDGEIAVGGACNAYQDGVLDCCTSSGGALLCPAVPEAPPPP